MDEKYLQVMTNSLQVIEELKDLVNEYAEKAQAYDTLDAGKENMSTAQAAHRIKDVLGLKTFSNQKLHKILISWGDIRDTGNGYQAYQKGIDAGYYVNAMPEKNGLLRGCVRITPTKGLQYIIKKMQRKSLELAGLIEYKNEP